jgi:hypothetical protein
MKHPVKIFLSFVVALSASFPAIADCQKCHDDYILDLQFCNKQDTRSQPVCKDNANKKLESCMNASGCR